GGQRRVVLVHHRRAGRGRGDDRLVVAERADERTRHRQRVVAVAGVEVHLAAAGLPLGELDLVSEALQHGDDGLAGVREQRVGQACDEQPDAHQSPPRRPRYRVSAAASSAVPSCEMTSSHWPRTASAATYPGPASRSSSVTRSGGSGYGQASTAGWAEGAATTRSCSGTFRPSPVALSTA